MPTWKLHFKSSPSDVFRALSTPGGRSRWWSDSPESDATIHFTAPGGRTTGARIEDTVLDRRYRISWESGRVLTFDLAPSETGGTDLAATGVTGPHLSDDVAILIRLKAWVDFGADLRNHDENRRTGYLDH